MAFWCAQSAIFTTWPYPEKVCQALVYVTRLGKVCIEQGQGEAVPDEEHLGRGLLVPSYSKGHGRSKEYIVGLATSSIKISWHCKQSLAVIKYLPFSVDW